MARQRSPKAGKAKRRQGRGVWRLRLLGFVLLLALAGGAYGWWTGRHWAPSMKTYPDQGALVGARDGAVDFDTLKGLGAKFVYLEASFGADRKDKAFFRNLLAARAAGLEVGAVHVFDPCVLAGGQSANFVTTVPRDPRLLPPAIALRRTAEDCPERVSEAAIASELMTLINQIEMHAGKAAILAPSEEFEQEYGLAGRISRNLWLARDWVEPAYAGRPWVLWTANSALYTEAADAPLRWVVVQR